MGISWPWILAKSGKTWGANGTHDPLSSGVLARAVTHQESLGPSTPSLRRGTTRPSAAPHHAQVVHEAGAMLPDLG